MCSVRLRHRTDPLTAAPWASAYSAMWLPTKPAGDEQAHGTYPTRSDGALPGKLARSAVGPLDHRIAATAARRLPGLPGAWSTRQGSPLDSPDPVGGAGRQPTRNLNAYGLFDVPTMITSPSCSAMVPPRVPPPTMSPSTIVPQVLPRSTST